MSERIVKLRDNVNKQISKVKNINIDVKKMNPVGIIKKSKMISGRRQHSKPRVFEDAVEIKVGRPQGFNHKGHMVRDSTEKWGIRGLPEAWKEILDNSGMTREQVMKDQQKTIAVLTYATTNRQQEVTRQPLLSDAELKKRMKETGGIVKLNPETRYKKLDEIGEGASGVVFRVQRRSDDKIFAVKISSVEELKYIENEIAYHALSKHDNIVNYYETFQFKQDVWILMDLVDGGSLTDFLGEDNPEEWTEPYIAYVMGECLKGLKFMHDNYLLHRDIKSDNVLIGRDGAVKLADFGFAVGLSKENSKRKSTVGTPFWMAPEVIEGKEYDDRCDIWSLGITAIELVNHEPPHMDKPHVAALLDILTEPAPKPKNIELWSDSFLSFLENMLEKEFTKRWKADKLLGHPFLERSATLSQFAGFVNHILDAKAQVDSDEDGI